ncbi:MAG: hypothetical protein MUP25_04535, partial [Syntrophales bacterium]|nr:hypothetical protein [Syntrophales bacterium]
VLPASHDCGLVYLPSHIFPPQESAHRCLLVNHFGTPLILGITTSFVNEKGLGKPERETVRVYQEPFRRSCSQKPHNIHVILNGAQLRYESRRL